MKINWNTEYFKRLSTYTTLITTVCSTIASMAHATGLPSDVASYLTSVCLVLTITAQTVSFKVKQTT